MIKRISAMKAFLKPERDLKAAYNVNATKTNAPIRTIVPATTTTTKNLAIPANAGMTRFVAGMARFVRYVGGCRPGDDSLRLIWEAVFS
jgi:hypothetical protein